MRSGPCRVSQAFMSSFSTVPSMVSAAPSSVAVKVNVFFDTLPLLIGMVSPSRLIVPVRV